MAPRGTVLLVDSFDGRSVYAEYLRTNDLLVYDSGRPEDALKQLDVVAPEVVVTDFIFPGSGFDGPSFIREVRARIDDAASLLVVSGYMRREDRERAQAAGADFFLVKPVLPSAVLYDVQRALILRRSGRRLPWNWRHEDRRSVAVRPHVERRCRCAS